MEILNLSYGVIRIQIFDFRKFSQKIFTPDPDILSSGKVARQHAKLGWPSLQGSSPKQAEQRVSGGQRPGRGECLET